MKARSRQITFQIITITLLSVGTAWLISSPDKAQLDPQSEETTESVNFQQPESASQVFPLVSQSQGEKVPQLQEIAKTGNPADQNRARYLLGVIALEEKDPETALKWLNGLEKEYLKLSEYILLKQAKAYELKGETASARQIWKDIASSDLHRAVVAEAQYQLGKYNSQHWDNLIQEFPKHPRTHEVIQQCLRQNRDQFKLLRLLAKQIPQADGMNQVRDQLVDNYKDQLTPQDWQMIADGYWESKEFETAAKVYENAPVTPQNLYRQARGLQVNGQMGEAQSIYQQLVTEFPEAEKTGLALRRLAEISSDGDAFSHLEKAINNFPEQAPAALTHQANLLEGNGKLDAAQKARDRLLEQYSDSNAAANYRWEMAQESAHQGSFDRAIEWAESLIKHNTNHSKAPTASFWKGQWLQRQGKMEAAETAFQQTLSDYTYSYYAWRSAVHLDLPVGEFTTIRDLNPELEKPRSRPLLPAGSQVMRELHRLGQDEMAWQQWQIEHAHNASLSVAEQFTEGVLRITQQQYLRGIDQISSLQYREDSDAIAQWRQLRQQPMYWHHLFPFPYYDKMVNWSQKREINPLLTLSLIRQESRFEKEIGSVAGAKGLMQLIPSTAEWVAQQVNLQDYSLQNPEDNINLGTWYLDYTHRQHNNNSMLAMASYNAGSGEVSEWVNRYGTKDPDQFVQQVPFPETKGYIEAVFGNYWNYLRLYHPDTQQLLNNQTNH